MLRVPRATWVPPAECATNSGTVVRNAAILSYGSLVAKAATLPTPDLNGCRSQPKDFKIIGKPHPGGTVRWWWQASRCSASMSAYPACCTRYSSRVAGIRRHGPQRQCRPSGTARHTRCLRVRGGQVRWSADVRARRDELVTATRRATGSKWRGRGQRRRREAKPCQGAVSAQAPALSYTARAMWKRPSPSRLRCWKRLTAILHRPRHLGTAELHGALQRRQGRDLGADSESGTGPQDRREDAG